MPKITYQQAVGRLRSAPSDIKCSEMRRILEDLGFKVRERSSGKHHTYTHPEIKRFFGSNYDCGHGQDPKLKPAYTRGVLKVLEEFESELRAREP